MEWQKPTPTIGEKAEPAVTEELNLPHYFSSFCPGNPLTRGDFGNPSFFLMCFNFSLS